jgi:hypothetical protein
MLGCRKPAVKERVEDGDRRTGIGGRGLEMVKETTDEKGL